MARNFVWLAITGGAWSFASNWNDLTDGSNPSTLTPTSLDSVTVSGPAGAASQTITGPGQAAAALFTGNTLLSGTFSIGALTLGQSSGGGLLQLAANTALSTGTATIVSGSLLAAGAAATLSVSGSLTLGSTAGAAATLNATAGGRVSTAALFLASAADSIYVDPTSIIEIGTAATALAGALTIDPGATLAGQGNANAYGQVTNNGTITAQSGTLTIGTLSGTGALQIAPNATLALNGACPATQSVAFTGPGATLAIREEFYTPAGPITGFSTTDALDIIGSQISSATYTAATSTLSLFYGTQIAATLTLQGTYTNTAFLTAADGNGGTLITTAPTSGGGTTPSPGTSTPDQYTWIAPGSAAWITAANWTDVTRAQTPAAIAPGAHDLVTIATSASTFTVIAGPANAATLALTGEVALSGTYAIGALSIGLSTGTNFTPATLDLLPATTLAAQSATIAAGAISASGSTTALTIAGTLTLGGGPLGIGLPTAALTASAGATIQAATLTMGGGSGASLLTDPTASIEIGTLGGATPGAITIDANATLSGNGTANPLGAIIDNGTILATGGTLTLGTITGTGSLTAAANATLELLAPTADPITLSGSATAGPAVLAFASARDAPTGTITGLVPGDAIHLEGSTLTAVQFNNTTGTLSLIYGTTAVARLHLAGTFTNIRFLLNPDGAGGSLIVMAASSGGGGGGNQTGTDQLAWTTPVSGSWNRAANWTDLTINAVATAPPGASTPVTLNGPSGATFQNIAGGGTSASIAASGNTVLNGQYTTGALSLAPGATLSIQPAAQIAATQALVTSADILASGNNASVAVAGTLTLAGTNPLAFAQAGGAIQCQALSLTGTGATISSDAPSVFEVGTLGGVTQGALTIDAGAEASGAGTLDIAGPTINNGLILAHGGTLWLGEASGTGTLSIGTQATLALAATDTCPVTFTGGGATLLLATPQFPTGLPITGFTPGDAIVTANTPIDTATYQPTTATIGTLTLTEAGQTVGALTLSGSYAGDQFSVAPDGQGAQITVTPTNIIAPPPGTVTPDAYTWIGGHGSAWSTAANWTDTTQSQTPAALPPGLNDTDTITGPTGQALTIAGPANAAALSLSGTVALTGTYAIGTLTVSPIGILAIGPTTTIAASSATIAGGAALNTGTFSVAATLTLGSLTAGGALSATAGATAQAGAILLLPGSTLAADATSSIDIGTTTTPTPGTITIDPGFTLAGAGTIAAAAPILDQGTITASGGTLMLGAVAGTGTLLIGIGAQLDLQSTTTPGLVADFSAAGTLFLAQPATAPAIADFGAGDAILLAPGGATTATYAQTAPNQGVLTIASATGTLAELTLLGSQTGLAFSVAGAPGGGTILTASAAQNAGPGGSPVTSPISASETITLTDLTASLEADVAPPITTAIANAYGTASNNPVLFVGYSPDGQNLDPPSDLYPNLEVVGPNATPGSAVYLATGFSGLLLEGTESLTASDNNAGRELLISNTGQDTIFAGGEADTLVGAPGAHTTFLAALAGTIPGALAGHDVTILGGGDDNIYTNNDSALISTAAGHHSTLILGSPQVINATNDITLNGTDTIVCGNINGATSNDNVTVAAAATAGGELVFGQARGLLNFVGGNTPATIVGSGGQLYIHGGNADGSLIFAGPSALDYTAGAGAAVLVAGAGQTQINAGAGGAVTVFGGAGEGEYAGAPGSIFVVGGGASTVQAAAGIAVYAYGNAPVSIAGAAGADVYAGASSGADIFQAGAGPETLWGSLGNNIFLAGTGNATLDGGGGNDTFNFTNGLAGGTDVLLGFVPGQDTIKLDGYGLTPPTVTTAFGNSYLNLSDGTQIIVFGLTNLPPASITLG